MFTQSCFIRKNNPELRQKLKELGYKEWDNFIPSHFPIIYTFSKKEKGLYTYAINDKCLVRDGEIDCGTNEHLFLALVALRDDSDYMQWFVSKGWKNGFGNLPDKWVLCTQKTLAEFGTINNSPNSYTDSALGWRKVTPDELIEHFKNK